MEGYLGTTDVTHEYKRNTRLDYAMIWISKYGGFNAAYHKAWVIDQVARILSGTPVIVERARWENGKWEDRYHLGEPSKEYLDWREEMRGEYDEKEGEWEYDYPDVGVAP